MTETITLKHTNHTVKIRREPFYDGWGTAYDGLITLPVKNINHIRAAWFRGYQLTPKGQRLLNFQAIDAYIEEERVAADKPAPKKTTRKSTKSAKSAEKVVANEDTNTGG